jgi:hypothetical protein
MSVRHAELTPAEQAVQDGLNRSWAHARDVLADPDRRAELEQAIDRVNRSSAKPMTKDELLARIEPLTE